MTLKQIRRKCGLFWMIRKKPTRMTHSIERSNEWIRVALRRRQPTKEGRGGWHRFEECGSRGSRQSIISRAMHTGSGLQAQWPRSSMYWTEHTGPAGVDGRPLLLILTYVSRGVTCARILVAKKMGWENGCEIWFEQWFCWRRRSRHDLTTCFSNSQANHCNSFEQMMLP